MIDARDKHGANLLAFLASHAATGVLAVFVTTLVLGHWEPALPRGAFIALSVVTVLGFALVAMCGWCITTCSVMDFLVLRGPTRWVAWLCGAGSSVALIAVQSWGSVLFPLLAIPAFLGLLAALLSGASLGVQHGAAADERPQAGARG